MCLGNEFQNEVMRGINSGNACRYSVRKLLLYRLLCNMLKISLNSSFVSCLHAYEMWSLTLRGQRKLEKI